MPEAWTGGRSDSPCIPGAIIGSARTFEVSCEPHLDVPLPGWVLDRLHGQHGRTLCVTSLSAWSKVSNQLCDRNTPPYYVLGGM